MVVTLRFHYAKREGHFREEGFGALAAAEAGVELSAEGRWGGTPRSVAFNVHGFRVAVNRGAGELRIPQSVQAADVGVVVNPRQCRGQVEGGIAQALGAALYEVVVDDAGRVTTDPSAGPHPHLRECHPEFHRSAVCVSAHCAGQDLPRSPSCNVARPRLTAPRPRNRGMEQRTLGPAAHVFTLMLSAATGAKSFTDKI